MADEALNCLKNLLESVPGWITDLENIVKSAVERQKEILFENQPADDNQPIDSFQDRPRKASKTSSVGSNRSNDPAVKSPQPQVNAEAAAAAPVQMQRPHMTHSDELRLAQRKRKTASVCSRGEDGPYKFRSRGMVVIYYDGETQKRFEGIVRAISSCRNVLRKGKMSARLEMMSRRDPYNKQNDQDSDDTLEMPKIQFRSARQAAALSSGDGTQSFDKIDSFLDKAQMMCERAAHQVLRDGDCALEIKHARQHFSEVTRLGDAEVVVWTQRAEEATERERLEKERHSAEERDAEQSASYSSDEKLVSDKEPYPSPTSVDVNNLEADDSDGDDEDVDLTKMRRTYDNRPFLRSASLTSH